MIIIRKFKSFNLIYPKLSQRKRKTFISFVNVETGVRHECKLGNRGYEDMRIENSRMAASFSVFNKGLGYWPSFYRRLNRDIEIGYRSKPKIPK